MGAYNGATLMIDALPKAKALLADWGCNADLFRNALKQRGIVACIPSRTNRQAAIQHDNTVYRQRHKVHTILEKTQGLAPQPTSSRCRNET